MYGQVGENPNTEVKKLFFLVIIVFCFSCKSSKEEKIRNGIHLSELLEPFSPEGLEKHLYSEGFEKFYSQLESSLQLMKESRLVKYDTTLSPNMSAIVSYKTGIKFWNGEVLLYDLNDPSFLFVDNGSVRLNIHRLYQKENLKIVMRIALMNEATNLVFGDPLNQSVEGLMKEELLSDFIMSLCSDEELYLQEWFRLVSGRFDPALNTGDYAKMSVSQIANAQVYPLGSVGYIETMRKYSYLLSNVVGRSSEELSSLQSNQVTFLDMICKDNNECYGQGIVSFWSQQLTKEQKLTLKKECKEKFKEEIEKYW